VCNLLLLFIANLLFSLITDPIIPRRMMLKKDDSFIEKGLGTQILFGIADKLN
jgi:uncharacterized membrane protein